MAQDRSNQLAVPVEADGPPNRALHVVGHECGEQLVDLVVCELGEETTDTARDSQVRAELRPPPSLIDDQICTAQSVVSQSVDQCFGGQSGGEQAIEDAAACGRFREPGGVTDGQYSIAVCRRRRTHGKEPSYRLRKTRSALPAQTAPGKEALHVTPRITPPHDADLRPPAFAPAHRDDPRETLRRRRSAEMKLHGRVGDISVDLELCGMEEMRRQSQSELPLETVSDTAGDDTGPSRQGSAIGPEHPHVCLLGPELHHLRAVRDLDPGPRSGSPELAIELAAIDDQDSVF